MSSNPDNRYTYRAGGDTSPSRRKKSASSRKQTAAKRAASFEKTPPPQKKYTPESKAPPAFTEPIYEDARRRVQEKEAPAPPASETVQKEVFSRAASETAAQGGRRAPHTGAQHRPHTSPGRPAKTPEPDLFYSENTPPTREMPADDQEMGLGDGFEPIPLKPKAPRTAFDQATERVDTSERNRPLGREAQSASPPELQPDLFSDAAPPAQDLFAPQPNQPSRDLFSGEGALQDGMDTAIPPHQETPPSQPAYDLEYFSQKPKAPPSYGEHAAQRAKKAPPPARGAAQKTKKRPGVYVARTIGVVCIVLVAIVGLLFGAITIVCKGPFPTAREMFVVSVTETSAVKFLANIYFSDEEVEEILAANAVLPPDETTDTAEPFTAQVDEANQQDIEIVDIKGASYVGKMMIIKDPTRIKLATLPSFGADIEGKKVEDFVAENNAVAGINAGGFLDTGGVGKGGAPLGMVIKDGQVISGNANSAVNMIGFTAEGQLLVGVMTGQEALDKGMVEGVHFEPTLIVNGQPAEVSGNGGGPNPRTVIGQREDGAVLLLVIDGRQPHSLGATLQDCMNEMLKFDAVNASNLDGGSSSVMIYQGEMINICASLYGSRGQPCAWIVV